jgi:hypothetical protein
MRDKYNVELEFDADFDVNLEFRCAICGLRFDEHHGVCNTRTSSERP